MSDPHILIQEAYTPRDFISKRYHVFVVRGHLSAQIHCVKDTYGFGGNEAQQIAKHWAEIIGCQILSEVNK